VSVRLEEAMRIETKEKLEKHKEMLAAKKLERKRSWSRKWSRKNYWLNREDILAKMKLWRIEHPEEYKKRTRAKYLKNKASALACAKRWRLKNPGYMKLWRAKQKANIERS
jgi:hypothetical protein